MVPFYPHQSVLLKKALEMEYGKLLDTYLSKTIPVILQMAGSTQMSSPLPTLLPLGYANL